MSREGIPSIPFGSIVKAVVAEVGPTVVLTEYSGTIVEVQIPEMIWVHRHFDTKAAYAIGDVIDVMIVRYNPTDRRYMGSTRRAGGDPNPLAAYAERGIGATYVAEIIKLDRWMRDLGTVKLDDGVWGECYLNNLELKVGDRVEVYAMEVDVPCFKIYFSMV